MLRLIPLRFAVNFEKWNHVGVVGATIMLLRSVMDDLGEFDHDYEYAEDYEMWLPAKSKGIGFANLPDVIFSYRLHDKRSSVTRHLEQLRSAEKALLYYASVTEGD